MRILVACHSYGLSNRWEIIKNTWATDIKDNHRFVFVGDICLYKRANVETWVCASGMNNHYNKLPLKTLNMLRLALQDKDWDFLYKTDDDTLFNIIGLERWLIDREIDPNKELYAGIPSGYVRNVWYAQGGNGYILSRPTLENNWDTLEQFLTEFELHRDNRQEPIGAEDLGVGHALASCGVKLNHTCRLMMHDVTYSKCPYVGDIESLGLTKQHVVDCQIDYCERVYEKFGGRDKLISIHHLLADAIQGAYNILHNK